MTLGRTYGEEGRLEISAGEWTLRRDDGGTWRLDLGFIAGLRARRFAGRRVRVTGIRIDFDVIAADRIEEAS